MTGNLLSLKEAVATYAASSANKLRGQHSVAGRVTVFLMTNRFMEDLPQYRNAGTYVFPVLTLEKVFEHGFQRCNF